MINKIINKAINTTEIPCRYSYPNRHEILKLNSLIVFILLVFTSGYAGAQAIFYPPADNHFLDIDGAGTITIDYSCLAAAGGTATLVIDDGGVPMGAPAIVAIDLAGVAVGQVYPGAFGLPATGLVDCDERYDVTVTATDAFGFPVLACDTTRPFFLGSKPRIITYNINTLSDANFPGVGPATIDVVACNNIPTTITAINTCGIAKIYAICAEVPVFSTVTCTCSFSSCGGHRVVGLGAAVETITPFLDLNGYAGLITLHAKAESSDGLSGSDSDDYTIDLNVIANPPETISLTAPSPIFAGQSALITLTVDVPAVIPPLPPNPDIASVTLNGPGIAFSDLAVNAQTYTPPGVLSSGPLAVPGDYTYTATVTDACGQVTTATVTVTVDPCNVALSISPPLTPPTFAQGEDAMFQARLWGCPDFAGKSVIFTVTHPAIPPTPTVNTHTATTDAFGLTPWVSFLSDFSNSPSTASSGRYTVEADYLGEIGLDHFYVGVPVCPEELDTGATDIIISSGPSVLRDDYVDVCGDVGCMFDIKFDRWCELQYPPTPFPLPNDVLIIMNMLSTDRPSDEYIILCRKSLPDGTVDYHVIDASKYTYISLTVESDFSKTYTIVELLEIYRTFLYVPFAHIPGVAPNIHLVVSNPNPEEANVSVNYYNVATIPPLAGSVTGVSYIIPPWGKHPFDMGLAPTGYAIINATQEVTAYARWDDNSLAMAVDVLANSSLSDTLYAPNIWYDQNAPFPGDAAIGWQSIITITNLGGIDTDVTVTYYNNSGYNGFPPGPIWGETKTISANDQEIFDPLAALPALPAIDFFGHAVITSNPKQPLMAYVELICPPAAAPAKCIAGSIKFATNILGTLSKALHAPDVRYDSGGWGSVVVISNPTSAPTNVTVKYYDDDGVLWGEEEHGLEPLGQYVFFAGSLVGFPDPFRGYATISSNVSSVAGHLYSLCNGAACSSLSEGSAIDLLSMDTMVTLPLYSYVPDVWWDTNEWVSEIVISNPNPNDAFVRIMYYNTTGSVVFEDSKIIPPGAVKGGGRHIFSPFDVGIDPFNGSAVIISTQPVMGWVGWNCIGAACSGPSSMTSSANTALIPRDAIPDVGCTLTESRRCGTESKYRLINDTKYINYIRNTLGVIDGFYRTDMSVYEFKTPKYSDAYGVTYTDYMYCYKPVISGAPIFPDILSETKQWCHSINYEWYSVVDLIPMNINGTNIEKERRWNNLAGYVGLGDPGDIATDTISVTVGPGPVASITWVLGLPDTYTFTGTAFGGAPPYIFEFNLDGLPGAEFTCPGAGCICVPGTCTTPAYTYGVPLPHPVDLTVTDSDTPVNTAYAVGTVV